MLVAVSGLLKNNVKEMIIVNLKGGLGNQMFQYSFGRRLSLETKTEFKLDKLDYERDTYRSYGLGIFNIIENFASLDEIEEVDPGRKDKSIFRKIRRAIEFRILRNYHIGWETNFVKKTIEKISSDKDVYLNGYWQSYKYFDNVRETLARDFSLKIPLEQTHPDLLREINSTNSIALAVRRGDYLWPENLKDFGICSENYYKKAVKYIESKVENPTFFIFSEDITWIKENISFNGHPVTYVSEKKQENPLTDYQEMMLMSKCQHNIIANSSFAWWPAWLNQNPNKIVIAPDVWFTNGSIKVDDIIPSTWIKLPRD